MTDEPMTLVERLRNPAWVHSAGGFGSYASPQLDIESTIEAMQEAADALTRLSELSAEWEVERSRLNNRIIALEQTIAEEFSPYDCSDDANATIVETAIDNCDRRRSPQGKK